MNPITNPELVTYQFLRTCLQQRGYARFFENISQIRGILTKQAPYKFSSLQKEQLTRIFKEIQAPFEKHRGNRKNFLSYSYTTYKSCELLGYHEFLPYLPLLKAPQNLMAADRLWKLICADLEYEYVDTIK